jgi:hypothetical protein
MAKFVTRVELHAGRAEDYEILRQSMESEGFRRTITAGDGSVYDLPTAEYYWETELTRDKVLEAAKRAATKTNKEFGAIVMETKVSTWYGLHKVADGSSQTG